MKLYIVAIDCSIRVCLDLFLDVKRYFIDWAARRRAFWHGMSATPRGVRAFSPLSRRFPPFPPAGGCSETCYELRGSAHFVVSIDGSRERLFWLALLFSTDSLEYYLRIG